MRRGEVWWASLPVPSGSGPGHRRPVLVVQSNPFNDSRIGTVVVAVITSNASLAAAPGNLRIPRKASGLGRVSVVNVSQLLTLDRRRLSERVRALPDRTMAQVSEGLKLVLGL
jgi:mRNA interferase MazF